jgi:hypothetical protein
MVSFEGQKWSVVFVVTVLFWFCLSVLGFEGFMLAGAFPLEPCLLPFCFGYFLNKVFLFAWAGLNCDPL